MRIGDCLHLRTKCVHGATPKKVKWWGPAVLREQCCVDCGALLVRTRICAVFAGVHEHTGAWS